MFILLAVLLTLSILLEGIVISLPLVLICLLCLTIVRKDEVVFPVAFVAGIFLDVMTLHKVGGASIFFLIFVLLILLYQRKYEINSYPFVAVSSFFGSLLFLLVFGYDGVFGKALISSVMAVLLFLIVRILRMKKN